jgi:SHS2 domain-containing protein
MYEVFEHTADVGLRVRANSLDELFADAGRALFALVVANLDAVRPTQSIVIDLVGDQRDYLLFDWLNELLYLFEVRRLLLSSFEVQVADSGLHARVAGEPIDLARHHLEHEVKAITYHGLLVRPSNGGWLAEVIVDI